MSRLAYLLTVAFVFTVPWEAALKIAAVGRGSKLLGFVAGLVWILAVLGRGRVRAPDTFHNAYFLFLIWSGLTVWWSIESDTTVRGVITYTQLFVMLMLLWDLFDSRRRIDTAIQAYVLGAYVASGSIIVNYLTAPEALYPAHTRINALGYQTDGIALIVAIAGPAAWYLAVGPSLMQRSPAWRIVNLAYLPVGLLALVLTGTRGATLASIPTVLLMLWSLSRARGRIRAMAMVAVVCAAVLIVQYAPQGQLDRIGTATTATRLGDETSALSGRWSIWVESTRVFGERPITGFGVDTHRAAVSPGLSRDKIFKTPEKEAHNTYISVLTETGIVGFALFAAVLAGVVMRLRWLTGWEAAYWPAQLGVLAIGAMSLSLEDSKSVWIFLSLAVAAASAARSRTVGETPLGPTAATTRVPLRVPAPLGSAGLTPR